MVARDWMHFAMSESHTEFTIGRMEWWCVEEKMVVGCDPRNMHLSMEKLSARVAYNVLSKLDIDEGMKSNKH